MKMSIKFIRREPYYKDDFTIVWTITGPSNAHLTLLDVNNNESYYKGGIQNEGFYEYGGNEYITPIYFYCASILPGVRLVDDDECQYYPMIMFIDTFMEENAERLGIRIYYEEDYDNLQKIRIKLLMFLNGRLPIYTN